MVELVHEQLIEWSAELAVGIQEIDEQHKVLVGLLNEMNRAVQQHNCLESAREILGRLGEATRIHFAVEESLMRVFEYPGYEEHKKRHEQLLRRFREYEARVASGQQDIGFQLLHFLKLWLHGHIAESDKDYAPFMLQHGMKARAPQESWFQRLWH